MTPPLSDLCLGALGLAALVFAWMSWREPYDE